MRLSDQSFLANLNNATNSLLHYCRTNQWAGYDPYDALNSTLFRRTPLFQSKICRIAFTQALKSSPFNVRLLVGVPKEQNPKALALFSTALLKIPHEAEEAKDLLELLMSAKSAERPYPCWGYNFDWQNRTTFVPRAEPNIICTTFAGNALLDAYEKFHEHRHLAMASSASEFLFQELGIAKFGDEICFSYTPRDQERVHNANLLGAAFLARLYRHTGIEKLFTHAVSAARFSVNRQSADGSWPYGESPSQQWIDNFHTGYNLIALRQIANITGISDFNDSVRKGFDFYRKHFFEQNGTAKYYHDQTYPIDVHSIAQSIITLVELRDLRPDNLRLTQKVCQWAFDNMRHKSGCYYFRKHRFHTNRAPYMRWAQAWMFLALVTLKDYLESKENLQANLSSSVGMPP